MSFLSKTLEHPIVIALLFGVGFYSIVYPGDDWGFYLGIFIVVATFFNLIKYIKGKNTKPVKPKCEHCGFIALDEKELHNHQMNCGWQKK